MSPAEVFGEWNPEMTFSDATENVLSQYRELGAEAEFFNDEGETLEMVVPMWTTVALSTTAIPGSPAKTSPSM